MCMSRQDNAIPGNGREPPDVGINLKSCGLTNHRTILSSRRLLCCWPPNQRQRRHPCRQSPSVGVCIRGMVQPPAPPQRYPFRYARSTPWRPGRRNLSPPCPYLRAGPSESSSQLEPKHPLLATTKDGLDQSTTTGKQHQTSYLGNGRLIGGRGGVIFPNRHRLP